MHDYSNEINELLADGWDYDKAVEWCEFVFGGCEVDEDKQRLDERDV